MLYNNKYLIMFYVNLCLDNFKYKKFSLNLYKIN